MFISDCIGFKKEHVNSEQQLKIGIIDADLLDHGTNFPNLALLKISGYCKSLEHNVRLLCDYNEVSDGYDLLIMSRVFKFTKIPKKIQKLIDNNDIIYGGTGFFEINGPSLENEVEHFYPDYSLYNEYINKNAKTEEEKHKKFMDYIDFSIGFATRGCFRKCPFCVNRLFDKVERHSLISEFYDSSRKGIYLCDDNVMGSSDFFDIIEELKETGKEFQFRQGLDMRLMTDKKAEALAHCKYHGDFIFAFDHIKDADIIRKKLEIWRNHTKKSTKLYVLTGFDSQDEIDIQNTFERIRILMEYNCLPFVMKHENYKKSKYEKLYVQIARWCNQPSFFRNYTFRQFCEANEEYSKKTRKKDGFCTCYQSMLDFERDFPEIAKKYYDIKITDYFPLGTSNTRIGIPEETAIS